MQALDLANRANAEYIEQMYQRYRKDPNDVDGQWRAFFAGFEAAGGRPGSMADVFGPAEAATPTDARVRVEVQNLVHSYRDMGHFLARLDPLGHSRPNIPLLDLKQFGLSEADLDKHVTQTDFRGPSDGTVRDLVNQLRATYCSSIGVEFMGISDKKQRDWLIDHMEPILNRPAFTPAQTKSLLYEIVAAQGLEEFLGLKWPTQKRFSLEGSEALVPLLNVLVDDGADLGVKEIVLGMAHRGRINVLAHVLNKPYELVLAEFAGTNLRQDNTGDGDVKYHLGYANDRATTSGKRIHMALGYNPSHLELVDPVIVGIVRAKQNYLGDHATRTRVVPVLVHGDASFTGQGIVAETLSLSELPYYRTGGTIHVIVNNQIGFTTLPRQGRFTPYPTDIAKMIQAPIFHVNGDDPEAVTQAARLAIHFRQEFHCDVLIDLWCYRRHGHNEVDEPTYTQPLMYQQIEKHPRLREIYGQKLIEEGRLSAQEVDVMKSEARDRLDRAMELAQEFKPRVATTMFAGAWKGFGRAGSDWSAVTKVSADTLRAVGEGATRVPPTFHLHPKLKGLMSRRLEMATGKVPIDWGGAEMLALGSLVLEGTPIRLVGQDTQRGTFSHRQSALRDYQTGEKYLPLANISDKQAPIIIVNTMLSEMAVLGFEYGFSSADPRNLVIWEAQFGDFVNEAQPIIDQFIAAAESKWGKSSGIVLLLPHGYEGQGPEHSNAYIERFLQLCAEDNMQVIYPSVPAQYFHVLRRQMKRNFRKPLVLFMPKSLLRDERYASRLDELTDGSFQTVIDDPANPARERVRRLLLCAGKVYFALDAARKSRPADDLAIVRIEQLYPYPQKELQAILAKYGNLSEVCWVQEEPRNRGGWTFMSDRLEPMLPETAVLTYCGRDEAASPATGSHQAHLAEEKELLARALELPVNKPGIPPPAPPKNADHEIITDARP
jgi:2-oxoglutarate dehydrogenase E1 component